MSREAIIQNENDVNNHELITIYLLSEKQVQSEVNTTVENLKSSASVRINSFMDYLRTTNRASFFISALNTNFMIGVVCIFFCLFFSIFFINKTEEWDSSIIITGYETAYLELHDYYSTAIECSHENPTTEAIFTSLSEFNSVDTYWYTPFTAVPIVNGFFAACTPLEGLLQSTLDCLYDIQCISLLINYFPNINEVSI